MSLRSLNRRHLGLISRYWTRYAVRGGGAVVFLLMALVYGLGVTLVILSSIQMAQDQAEAQGKEMTREEIVGWFVEQGRPIAQWAVDPKTKTDEPAPEARRPARPTESHVLAGESSASGTGDNRWSSYLIDERPALLSAIFLILVFGMPLLIPFIAFNQVSGDVQSRGLRYVLLRTERANIYFGRFLGTAAFSMLVMIFVVVIITAYLGLKLRIYPAGELWSWALRGCAALAILVVPYVALCSWLSARIDSPFLSLVSSSLVIGGVPLFAFLASLRWPPAGNLKYLLPWGIQNHLLHWDPTHTLGAAAACLGYTAVFLFLGYWHFERRDL